MPGSRPVSWKSSELVTAVKLKLCDCQAVLLPSSTLVKAPSDTRASARLSAGVMDGSNLPMVRFVVRKETL